MKHTPTEQVIYEMLVENTGVHMLDSGGVYGRNWQRNQVRTLEDFELSKRVVGRFDVYEDGKFEVDVSLSTFHFLVDRLDYDEELTKNLLEFADKDEDTKYDSWPETIEKWLERVDPFKDVPIKNDEWSSENSYNGESLLTQVIQFWYPRFVFDSDSAPIILQIHGGCDVRGGYTAPRVFYGGTELFRSADATMWCQGINNDTELLFENDETRDEQHYWQTDDGYNWYFQGCSSHKLEEYSALKEETNEDVEKRGKDGLLHVDDDGNGYCPICGGLLVFDF